MSLQTVGSRIGNRKHEERSNAASGSVVIHMLGTEQSSTNSIPCHQTKKAFVQHLKEESRQANRPSGFFELAQTV